MDTFFIPFFWESEVALKLGIFRITTENSVAVVAKRLAYWFVGLAQYQLILPRGVLATCPAIFSGVRPDALSPLFLTFRKIKRALDKQDKVKTA